MFDLYVEKWKQKKSFILGAFEECLGCFALFSLFGQANAVPNVYATISPNDN